MRRHIVSAIVGTRGKAPTNLVDYVEEWEPTIRLRAKFCPWCGKPLAADAPVNIVTPIEPDEDDGN